MRKPSGCPAGPDFRTLFEAAPGLYLVLDPDLQIIAVSDAYLKSTLTKRDEIVGRGIFDVFPDNPNDLHATGVDNLRSSLNTVLTTKTKHVMAVQKYDIRIPGRKSFEERYWSPANSPVLDARGEVLYIIHQVEDVTASTVRLRELKFSEAQYKEHLRETESKFRFLVENVKDYAIYMIDAAGCILSWNKGAQYIKGYSENEIVGKNISVFYSVNAREDNEPEKNLRRAAALGQYEVEGWRFRKDGSRFWADVVLTALYDNSGRLKGFAKVTRDITESKTAQDILKEYGERFFSMLNNCPVNIYLTRVADGKFVYVNNAFVKVFNRPAEEIIGRTSVELNMLSAEARAGLANAIIEHGGNIQALEIKLNVGDKEEREMLISSETIDIAGEQCFLATLVDITERKKSEEEVRRANQFLDTILENIPNMVFVKEAGDLRFLRFNKAGEELLGYSREDLIGKNDYDFFPEDQARFFTDKDREVIRIGKVVDIPEEAIHTRDGEKWLHTKKIPILNEAGTPLYLLGISEDITHRKLSEEHIVQLNKDLENNVVQLEAANKELESFSYSVSHDLRAPLRAIHGYTKIVFEKHRNTLAEEDAHMMAAVLANAKKMAQLIDDLLAFSRLGKKELQRTPVDMRELMASCIEDLEKSQSPFTATIDIKELHEADADLSLAKQVVFNLLGNAVKYSRLKDKPTIEVGSFREKDATVFYIKDNGVGFDMRYYGKLFGVFQRLHTDAEFEGTGVGLALVHRIISRHGGKVWAEAEPDKGAAFYFSFDPMI